MNILSELLAGARQVRTPLAVGYLWLLVAWINVTRTPDTIRNADLVTRATQDLKHLSPALVVVIVSAAAYLIGLFFELLDDFLVKGGVVAAGLAFFCASSILVVVMLVYLWWLSLAFFLLFIIGYLLSVRGMLDRVKKTARRSLFHTLILISHVAYSQTNLIRRVWSTATPVKNDLVADSAIRLFDNHPEALSRFFETLSIFDLRSACYEIMQRTGPVGTAIKSKDGQVQNVSKIVFQTPMDPVGAQSMRDYLAERFTTSLEIRKTVALRVINLSDVRDLVNRAIQGATSRIQAENPSVFDSYDRLRAESELRCGVALPMGVALSSAVFFFSSNPWPIAAAAVPAVFVYFSGMKKQEEAMAIIVHSITAEITSIKLNVDDIRLLRWQEQGPETEKKPSVFWSRIRQLISGGRSSKEIAPETQKSVSTET
jgi:hypothetical protein